MGYSYRKNYATGRLELCCDICGKSGGVRKYHCPFGYCPPIAACQECRKNPEHKHHFSKKFHREHGCEKLHLEFTAKEEKKYNLIDNGIPVRCSALNKDNKIHVLFHFKADPKSGVMSTVGYYMSKATYDAIPLGEVATPDDFRKFGTLEEAPNSF